MVLAEEYNGVQVVRVEPGSPAFKCKDLQQGNILVSVAGKKIKGLSLKRVLELLRGACPPHPSRLGRFATAVAQGPRPRARRPPRPPVS